MPEYPSFWSIITPCPKDTARLAAAVSDFSSKASAGAGQQQDSAGGRKDSAAASTFPSFPALIQCKLAGRVTCSCVVPRIPGPAGSSETSGDSFDT